MVGIHFVVVCIEKLFDLEEVLHIHLSHCSCKMKQKCALEEAQEEAWVVQSGPLAN